MYVSVNKFHMMHRVTKKAGVLPVNLLIWEKGTPHSMDSPSHTGGRLDKVMVFSFQGTASQILVWNYQAGTQESTNNF